jgi:hypothetical protein
MGVATMLSVPGLGSVCLCKKKLLALGDTHELSQIPQGFICGFSDFGFNLPR